jgi:EAL and modified HD-GYP domain-containing signal transduction protein
MSVFLGCIVFSTGLFSTLNAMMDRPIDELMTELPLDENLKSALSQHKEIHGEALHCVIAMETNQLDDVQFHNIEFARLSEIYLKALIWADQQAAEITARETLIKRKTGVIAYMDSINFSTLHAK